MALVEKIKTKLVEPAQQGANIECGVFTTDDDGGVAPTLYTLNTFEYIDFLDMVKFFT